MFSSNSFNVCPHCGKANSLNARYCSSCGKQLAVPEEVIVCPKCHKTNSPMASFCGGCGTQLRTGQQTKICPRCHKDVDINENLCSCGYSFSSVKYATPTNEKKKAKAEKPEKVKTRSKSNGGRVVALFALIFLLVFAYLAIVPQCVIRPEAITKLDGGLLLLDGSPLYVYDLLMFTINAFVDGGGFADITTSLGIGGFVLALLSLVFVLVVIMHLIITLARLATSSRSYHASKAMLILAIVNTAWIAIAVAFQMLLPKNSDGFVGTLRGIFVPACKTGLILYVLPIYYWFFTLFTALTKAKKIKEDVA